MSERTKDILEWVYCILIAIVLALLIKFFLGTPTVVKQKSMESTLEPNDRLILSRVIRTSKKLPKRGDIITFEAPSVDMPDLNSDEYEFDPSLPKAIYKNEPTNIFSKFKKYVLEIGKTSYIKRVIALPGDYVELKNGQVYVNGEELQEDYLNDNNKGKTEPMGYLTSFTVPEGYVFCMGDNRRESKDCRSFGCIPQNKIESRVKFRFWPFSKFGGVD